MLFVLLDSAFAGTTGQVDKVSFQLPENTIFQEIKDTINPVRDSIALLEERKRVLLAADSTGVDSTATDSLKSGKMEMLQFNIEYTAVDSIVMDEVKKRAYLYNQGDVRYGSIQLQAGYIEIDYENNIAYARGIQDSTGMFIQKPVFTQDGKTYNSFAMTYNFNTEKAYIKNVKTEEQEGYAVGRDVKKSGESTFYAKDFYFSTDEKLQGWIDGTGEKTDYYIKSKKVKMNVGQSIITGPSMMYLADVPTPLVLPFAYFPMTPERSGGVLLPTYNNTQNQGFGLTGGGYYFTMGDYFDMKLTADIYTKGSWGIAASSAYKYRYHFSGNFSFNYENLVFSEQGLPDYSKSSLWRLAWTHSQDPKANPNFRFSASVNMTSSRYYQNSLNQIYNDNFLNNTTSSSVNITKSWEDSPFNLSMAVRHSQNNQSEQVNLTLPSFNLSMNRLYPFKSKTGSGNNWYENINLSWTMDGRNELNVPSSEFGQPGFFDNAKMGIQHRIPINTSFKVLKYFTVSGGVNYNESWYFDTVEKTYSQEADTLITNKVNGFDAYREFGANAAMSTVLYGMLNFGNDKKWKAIRHVMTPSVNYSYRPDFSDPRWGYYEAIQTGDNLGEIQYYSRFEEGIYGRPSTGMTNSLGINLSNNFEAKIQDPKDSTKVKKIKLLNQLNVGWSYNFAATEFNMSDLTMNGGNSFFKDRLRWNFRLTLNPYALDENNQIIDVYKVNTDEGGLFRLTNAGTDLSFSLRSDDFNKDKNKNGKSASTESNFPADITTGTGANGEFGDENEVEEDKGDEEYVQGYLKYRPKWDMSFRYTLNYQNRANEKRIGTNAVDLSGNLTFSKNWKMGFSTAYDFRSSKIVHFRVNFGRDLNTWRFTFNWSPLPATSSNYSFYIGIKANILKDLKFEKQDTSRNQFF